MKVICSILIAICFFCQVSLAGMYEQEMIRFVPGMLGIFVLFGVMLICCRIGHVGEYKEEE